MATLRAMASELTAEATEGPPRTQSSSVDPYGAAHRRFKVGGGSPPRSEPVALPSDGVDRAIDYFDFGPTKEAVVLVPDLNRHVLSMAVDAEGVRQLAKSSAVSQPLQGPVDRSLAAMPTASGVTAPSKSPYINAVSNRKRSGRYTERPPKLCTPNNASRPVTSSDFAAFKNHTVNRNGTPNTLRTPLGSAATGAGAGGSGGPGGAAAVEARGVVPLTALLGPPWLPPAMRPKSPHLGVGGVTGSATSVPGLHVPLELDPPARTPSRTTSPQQQSQRSSGVSDPDGGAEAGGQSSMTTSVTGMPPPPSQAAVVAPRMMHTGPAPVRCGAGELLLDVNAWLTPVSAPGSELCGVFYGDEGGDSVALMSRVVKGTVQCDLGWAEISESLMFMSTSVVPNAVLRFALPHRAVLQRFAATIGGTTMIAEAVARNSGSGLELDEEDEDEDSGKLFSKAFGRRNHPAGPGGRAPMLRVPLGKVKGDIFVTVQYLVQLESSGNTLSLTHVCNWTPPRSGWHLMTREQLAAEWYGSSGPGRKGRAKSSDLYDLSFELEILSHRGLNLVSGPRHMTIKPNYDALLIQGFTQVWRPRHVTQVIFEVALPVPVRSFAILQDARRPDADTEVDNNPPPRRAAAPAVESSNAGGGSQTAQGATGGDDAPASRSLSRSRSIKLMIPANMSQTNSTALLGGELGGPYNGRRPQTAADAQQESWSRRNCAAVTFVPGSHFGPAELEEALGDEIAPGPRAQAAALRAGLPGTPPPMPAELLIVLDCCGPTGMASHLMQMMQTLLLLLRSLPAAEGPSPGAGGGGAAAAAAAVAAAGMFNVVICPAAPPQPEEEESIEGPPNPTWPQELVVLHSARRQQQQQLLQQHLQATGQTPRTSERPRSPNSSHPAAPQPGTATATPPAAAPVWLFPGGSRPVTADNVESAISRVATLLADPSTLVAWAQPISRLHSLLCDLERLPRAPGCRRTAVVLCHQLVPDEEAGGSETGAVTATPFVSNNNSRSVSRNNSRLSSAGHMQPRRSLGPAISASMGAGSALRIPPSSSRVGPMQAVAEVDAEDEGEEPEVESVESEPCSPTTHATAAALRQSLSIQVEAGPHVAFGGSSLPTADALSSPPPSPARAPAGVSADCSPEAAALGSPVHFDGASEPVGRAGKAPAREQRPRSSMARSGHGRPATTGGSGDGVRWSYGLPGSPDSRRAVTDVGNVASDSDGMEAQVRNGGGSRRPSASDGEGSESGGDRTSMAPTVPDPPELDFPVFVVVHSLMPHSHAALMAGAGGAVANGPSYLMAYQLYQRHLEGLLYDRAREEVQQLPLSYLERLADDGGGFLQTASSAHDLGSALVLAASCAVTGRYLRELRLVARGSVLREQYPPTLPAALPLGEPLSLLVRLAKMQPGAALVLHAVWPSGRPVQMEVSVDPKLKTAGTLLPMLCVLSELSVLLKEAAPIAPLRLPSILGYGPPQAAGSSATIGLNPANPSSLVASNPGGGLAGGNSNISRRSALRGGSNSQLQLDDSGSIPQSTRLTPKQQAARKRAMERALAFNLVTPVTAMALVSMTLAGNRGLAVQTLQTTTSRPVDYRAGNFLWPSPVMTVLAAAAKEAAAAAAQVQVGSAAAAFHTAATYAYLAGAGQGSQPQAEAEAPATADAMLPSGAGAAPPTGRATTGPPGPSAATADDWSAGREDTSAGSELSDAEARGSHGATRSRDSRAASAVSSAHAMAVLARLALLQLADGSWPAGPELEELVISNGRHVHVPMLGGPKPATSMERHAAESREGRLRESLSGLREHTLRGTISGPAWATILALSLLRAKYGTQRLAWIALEAKAFTWLQRKWPPPVVCPVSPPAAIMKVSALL
ncbi:hypothetical protein GPECTOR_25g457 [Gonium pectorale]|uniref:Uncharacterized protein n=1 Tax=Gonium pectorale TaxID=33097 RepID=A0A150GGB1_GONPE|nr:hypothetical protein GPECTOR_25g457 [Gonium pectorale]|eukprot:KXZ48872.1 hypothetical protein GPECTOR_25g457 [Gonium pectorale]